MISTRFYRFTVCGLLLTALALFPQSGRCAQSAVIATIQPDYSGAAHSVIAVDPIGGPRSISNNLLPTLTSDITVAAFGQYFYRIEKYMADTVTKFDIAHPDVAIWQYSTIDAGESSSNPYDLIFVNAEKAYLLRYEKTAVWIVNPAATRSADFKIGELDLSSYAGEDGIPEMHAGVLVGGKLFIAMQRIDRNHDWAAVHDAYVAVFNTITDQEIDTGTPKTDGVAGPGIQLPIRNTGAIQFLEENGLIYVQGGGDFNSIFYPDRSPGYTGGIVTIDPDTYEVQMVLNDGDDAFHPYGYISGMSIISADKGYFIGYAGWGDNTVYVFNPNPASMFTPVEANSYLKNKSIAGMESGTYADQNGMLWVCNQTDAEVVIMNTTDNSIDETISTDLSPTRVVFTSVGEPGGGSGGGSGDAGGSCFIRSLIN